LFWRDIADRLEAPRKTYMLCTNSEFASVTQIARYKISVAGEGWTYIELPLSHVPITDMPDRFYQLMLDAALWREGRIELYDVIGAGMSLTPLSTHFPF
jgi:hypothetical protein